MTGEKQPVGLEWECENALLNSTTLLLIFSAPTVTLKPLHLAWTPENEQTQCTLAVAWSAVFDSSLTVRQIRFSSECAASLRADRKHGSGDSIIQANSPVHAKGRWQILFFIYSAVRHLLMVSSTQEDIVFSLRYLGDFCWQILNLILVLLNISNSPKYFTGQRNLFYAPTIKKNCVCAGYFLCWEHKCIHLFYSRFWAGRTTVWYFTVFHGVWGTSVDRVVIGLVSAWCQMLRWMEAVGI